MKLAKSSSDLKLIIAQGAFKVSMSLFITNIFYYIPPYCKEGTLGADFLKNYLF